MDLNTAEWVRIWQAVQDTLEAERAGPLSGTRAKGVGHLRPVYLAERLVEELEVAGFELRRKGS